MAIKSRAVSVGTTATRLDTVDENDNRASSSIAVYNAGSNTVYLGGDQVTTANGTPLAAGEHYALDAGETEALYGIVAASTESVRVLEAGV